MKYKYPCTLCARFQCGFLPQVSTKFSMHYETNAFFLVMNQCRATALRRVGQNRVIRRAAHRVEGAATQDAR